MKNKKARAIFRQPLKKKTGMPGQYFLPPNRTETLFLAALESSRVRPPPSSFNISKNRKSTLQNLTFLKNVIELII